MTTLLSLHKAFDCSVADLLGSGRAEQRITGTITVETSQTNRREASRNDVWPTAGPTEEHQTMRAWCNQMTPLGGNFTMQRGAIQCDSLENSRAAFGHPHQASTHGARSSSEGYMSHLRFPKKYNALCYAYQRDEGGPRQNVSNNFTFPYSFSLLHCIFQAVQQVHSQKASAEFFGCPVPVNKSGANSRGLTCAVRPRRSWPHGISPCGSWCRSPVLCTGWLTPALNQCTSGRKGKHIFILTVHSQLDFSAIYCSCSRKALVAFSNAHNRSGVSWRERIPAYTVQVLHLNVTTEENNNMPP